MSSLLLPRKVTKLIKSIDEGPEELTHESEEVKQVIETVVDFIKEKGEGLDMGALEDEIKNQCITIDAKQPLKHYIAFNSCFTVNILDEFKTYKGLFKSYVDSDGESGVQHFIQTMVHFFMVQYPKLEIAISSFLKFVYDADIIDEQVLLKWKEKKYKTDKKSPLYNKSLEKKFKKRGAQFFEWLEEAESDEDEESEDEEESKKEMTEEELKAQKMKELIEQEKLKQEKELEEARQKVEETKLEEDKDQQPPEGKINVLDVKVEEDDDDIDIDDI